MDAKIDVAAGVIGIIIILGLVWWNLSSQPISNHTKFDNCMVNAGKIYDSERQTIAINANGYNAAEQQTYYQRSSDGYTFDQESCAKLYPH